MSTENLPSLSATHAGASDGRAPELGVAPRSAPSELWKHMHDTHCMLLLESEEADICRAVSETNERRIAGLNYLLIQAEGEARRLRTALEDLRQTVGGYLHGAEWDHWQRHHASRFLPNVPDQQRHE